MKIFSALVTPFIDDTSINYDCLKKMIDDQIQDGIDGFVIGGTTGEKPTLTNKELFKLYRFCVYHIDNRVPCILNVGTNCTRTTIETIKKLDDLDCLGFMIVVPYYSLPSKKGIYQHYRMISESTKKAIMIYNIPKRTGIEIGIELLKKCSKLSNIAFIKDCRHNYSDLLKIAKLPNIGLFLGNDSDFIFGIENQIVGIVSVISNYDLLLMKRLIVNRSSKDEKKYQMLNKYLSKYPNPIGIKKLLRKKGYDVGTVRLPLLE